VTSGGRPAFFDLTSGEERPLVPIENSTSVHVERPSFAAADQIVFEGESLSQIVNGQWTPRLDIKGGGFALDVTTGEIASLFADWSEREIAIDGPALIPSALAVVRVAIDWRKRDQVLALQAAPDGRMVLAIYAKAVDAAGKTIAGPRPVLFLQEGGELRVLYVPESGWSMLDLGLSANGRWLAVVRAQRGPAPQSFLLFDLEQWTVQELPLQPVKDADAAHFAPKT
jgi:hypothetical protein